MYFSEDHTPATSMVNFKDVTLKINPDGTMVKVPKSPQLNVYFHVDVELTYKPSDAHVLLLRRALAITFAGNPIGRHADTCADAL